ncbi:MAG TPA: hypothetical protein VN043_05045 [Rhodanobacter sp.]|nr:hypothetical protein [Rhodanobacter sp.]
MRPTRHWDGVAAIMAALIGLLALGVSGYTAYIQRQQVRAQVWPYLIAGNNDLEQSLIVYNKGVGPAIVRSAQIRVDGKPQKDWNHVLAALGLPPHHYIQSTLNPDVLSPGEQVQTIRFPENDRWRGFRAAAINRMTMDICYCSTLEECWVYSDRHPVGDKGSTPLVRPVDQCPSLPPAEVFDN